MTADKDALLREALPILQEFARLNPQHEYKGTKQDPRGVHSLVGRITAALAEPESAPTATQEPVADVLDVSLPEYDAGYLNDYGGGNVQWWQDYIRAELGRAHSHYQSEHESALLAERERADTNGKEWARGAEALILTVKRAEQAEQKLAALKEALRNPSEELISLVINEMFFEPSENTKSARAAISSIAAHLLKD